MRRVVTDLPGCGPEIISLTARPCFICGEMMEVLPPSRQLMCRGCDVTEACDSLTHLTAPAGASSFPPGTAATGDWKGVVYLDHQTCYAPTPLHRASPDDRRGGRAC
jgi:hypothetical protein